MNIALAIGKKSSRGVPGKNIKLLMNRAICEYSLIAAQYSKIEKIFVSTDSDEIKNIGKQYGAEIIDRPDHLAQSDTLTEDVLMHAYGYMKEKCDTISSITLLFCNTPTISVDKLNEAIDAVNTDEEIDSCCSVVKYDMFSPVRARKIEDDRIVPYVDLNLIEGVSSLRDTQASCYFHDFTIMVLNPRCFEDMYNEPLPFKWMGKRIKPILTEYGFDIDEPWQLPVIEKWLTDNGYTDSKIPWKK